MNNIYSYKKTATSSFAISLALHATILFLFAFINVSLKQTPATQATGLTVRIKSVGRLIEKAQTLPKPKISLPMSKTGSEPHFRPNQISKSVFSASLQADMIQSTSPAFGTLAQIPDAQSVSRENPTANPAESKAIHFFENTINAKRLCFVVDCSGSMQGIFEKVRSQLKDLVSSLEPDRYFQIIFFGDNQLYIFSKNSLVRASGPIKQEAVEFIDTIKPQGRTNAAEALICAMQNKDPAVNSPDVIYFLTDGFNLAQDNNNLVMSILNFRSIYCDKTRISTIGFWLKPQDESLIRQIVQITGGTFTLIDK